MDRVIEADDPEVLSIVCRDRITTQQEVDDDSIILHSKKISADFLRKISEVIE